MTWYLERKLHNGKWHTTDSFETYSQAMQYRLAKYGANPRYRVTEQPRESSVRTASDIVREIRDTDCGSDKRMHELAAECATELERTSANRDFWMGEAKKADKARMSAVRELEELKWEITGE